MRYIFVVLLIYFLSEAKMIRDEANEVVFDTATKKMWQDNLMVTDGNYMVSWEDAIEQCENLDLAGYTNWRLPNINELNTIADITMHNPALSSVFTRYELASYWSSTTYSSVGLLNTAWSIDFITANMRPDQPKIDKLYVRCIRDF